MPYSLILDVVIITHWSCWKSAASPMENRGDSRNYKAEPAGELTEVNKKRVLSFNLCV